MITYAELAEALASYNPELIDGWVGLKTYVSAGDSDDTFVQACWAEALELITIYVGTHAVPDAILIRATTEVGSELFHRRSAPNGVAQFTTLDGSAIRIARDPMVAAYPLLRRYVGWGLA